MPTTETIRLTRDYTQGLANRACAMIRYINKHRGKIEASSYATANSDYKACVDGVLVCLELLCDALDLEA